MRGYTVKTPELVAEAQRLRSERLTWREIGERLGVSLRTAHVWGTDPDGSRLAARKASYRGVCEECGGPTDGSCGPNLAPSRCRACRTIWTRDAVILAIQTWADEHGGIPPTQIDWNPSHPCATAAQEVAYRGQGWPSHMTVCRVFGGWNAGLIAAGFEPHRLRDLTPTAGQIAAELRAGTTVREIADRCGVTHAAVYMRLRNAGLSAREIARAA